jgi:serine/threonine protein kinase
MKLSKQLDMITKIEHENLVRHFTITENEKNLIIVMEYCKDGNLQQYLQQLKLEHRRLSLETVLIYMQQLSAALMTLHA